MVRDSEGLDSRPEIEEVTEGYLMENEVAEAVARGWCTPENSSKTLDPVLANAIVDQISDLDWSHWQGTFSSIPVTPCD